MKTPLIHRLVAPGLTAALALAASSVIGDGVYSGRINLNGEMQNAAKPGSISFVYTGQLTNSETGEKANVSGGGLFRSTSDAIVNANFRGKLTTYTRTATTQTSQGRLIKRVRTAGVITGRRTLRFPGGAVTLDRPINATRTEKQRISGRGTYRVRI